MAGNQSSASVASEAPRPTWLHSGEGVAGNNELSPEFWGLIAAQFHRFLRACQMTKEWEAHNSKGHVNFHDINTSMIVPWSRGTGCSIARLMNPDQPCQAQLMISHGWAENAVLAIKALDAFLEKHAGCTTKIEVDFPEGSGSITDSNGSLCRVEFGEAGGKLDFVASTASTSDIGVWFCTLSQYQPGNEPGDCGPTVQDQIAREPFKTVIDSRPPLGMVVLHTPTCNIYSRLWCVYEVDEALEAGVNIIGECDSSFVFAMDKSVDTEKACCGNPEDEAMIRARVLSREGGFRRLDNVIKAFRKVMYAQYRMSVEWGDGPEATKWSAVGTEGAAELLCYETWDGSYTSIKQVDYTPKTT